MAHRGVGGGAARGVGSPWCLLGGPAAAAAAAAAATRGFRGSARACSHVRLLHATGATSMLLGCWWRGRLLTRCVCPRPWCAEAVPLPEGWAVAKDPTTGKPYYYHKETKKVSCLKEAGAGAGPGTWRAGWAVPAVRCGRQGAVACGRQQLRLRVPPPVVRAGAMGHAHGRNAHQLGAGGLRLAMQPAAAAAAALLASAQVHTPGPARMPARSEPWAAV
jgi:hypothetical protein